MRSVTSVVQKFAAYAKLLRLSNAPTAVADVWMGYAVATGRLEPTLPLALMTAASLCLYHGGMALNDAIDADRDEIENRRRPISEGHISRNRAYQIAIGEKFSRPVTMAWPIISHEGRLHTISFDAWKKSVEAFGGAVPVSFCEDIIYYRKLRDALGADFQDSHTPVLPGEESFICISDGANASVIETMEDLNMEDLPSWAGKALELLYEAAHAGPLASHPDTLAVLGRQFAQKGEFNLREAMAAAKPGISATAVPAASFEIR